MPTACFYCNAQSAEFFPLICRSRCSTYFLLSIWIVGIFLVLINNWRILTPFFQNRIGRNIWIKYPLGNANIIHVLICRCRTTGTIHPPCAEPAITIQYATIVFKTSQIFLRGRPRTIVGIRRTKSCLGIERSATTEIIIVINTCCSLVREDLSTINWFNSITCYLSVKHTVHHHGFNIIHFWGIIVVAHYTCNISTSCNVSITIAIDNTSWATKGTNKASYIARSSHATSIEACDIPFIIALNRGG